MLSLIYYHAYRFLIALTIIFMLSPLPAIFRDKELSYWNSLQNIIHDIRYIQHLSIPTIDWEHENILFSPQTAAHTEDPTSSTLSFIWNLYSLSMFRFLLTFILGFTISFLIGKIFLQLSKMTQRFLIILLHRLPYSLTTVMIQCAIILLCISVTRYVTIPFFPSFIIIFSTCTILVIQAMKQWLPFLYKRDERHINNFSYFISTLYVCILANRKFLIGHIIVSFFYMECIFHVDGLFQFIVQYSVTSPTLLAIGLLLIYIPYMIITVLQNLLTTNLYEKHLYSVTETTNI